MNKSIIGSLIVLASIAISIFFVTNNNDNENIAQNTADTSGAAEISINEIAENSSETSCWTYIGNKVYDITEYIPRHPGGDDILLACGNDGTTLFEQRKTQDGEKIGSGFPHSANASSQLEDYFKGILVQ